MLLFHFLSLKLATELEAFRNKNINIFKTFIDGFFGLDSLSSSSFIKFGIEKSFDRILYLI